MPSTLRGPDDRFQALLKLGCTVEEARQVLADDERIDKGEDLFPLSSEQEKISKQMRRAPRAVSEAPIKRERKQNAPKRFLIDSFAALLNKTESVNDVQVTNPEREIIFVFNGVKYKVVLSAPRK